MSIIERARAELNAKGEAALRWWGRELAALVPAELRRVLSPWTDRLVISMLGEPLKVFSVTGLRGTYRELFSGDLDALRTFARSGLPAFDRLRPVFLRVSHAKCFVRHGRARVWACRKPYRKPFPSLVRP